MKQGTGAICPLKQDASSLKVFKVGWGPEKPSLVTSLPMPGALETDNG